MIDADRKAKIIWQCRRGMLELDLLLMRFLKTLETLNEEDIAAFEALLTCEDPSLYAYLMENDSPDPELQRIVQLIQCCH